MSICKHARHRVIDNIWEPRWHDRKVLINVNFISPKIEHYLIKFTQAKSMPGWYYLSLSDVLRAKKQKNGNGEMFIVSLNKLVPFTPLSRCDHTD